MLNLAVDLDGCLARFVPRYIETMARIDGTGPRQAVNLYEPPEWSFEESLGFSTATVTAAWKQIKKDQLFWATLDPMPGAFEACRRLDAARQMGVDVYFLTHRAGVMAKFQSEEWLRNHGVSTPTVILADDKAPYMSLLDVDAFVDDRLKNVNMCMRAVRLARLNTRIYLVDAPYNRRPVAVLAGESVGVVGEEEVDPAVIRVGSVGEMLDREGL